VDVPRVTFYFDLGSPYAYLAAERLPKLLPEPVQWQPVLLGGLFKLTGRSSWALGDHRRRAAGMAEIERRARSYGLAPMRWPDPWPADYLIAMRATAYAFSVQRGREFAMQAYRDAFVEGAELGVAANVFASAGRAGFDAEAVRAAVQDPQIKRELYVATDAAYDLGVFGVPTIAIEDELFWGDDRLEDAVDHLERVRAP
jgi:2-hydroxychromene-2-carboxylate isomerase